MKIADYLNIADKMKTMRKKSGISQRDMAIKLGVSNSAYSNYENGYNEPSMEILDEFCRLLNVSFNDLLGIQIPAKPKLKTYADLFSIFFQLEEMHIPITFDFYSEPEPISKQMRLGSKITIDMKNPQISTFISAWNAKKQEKKQLDEAADNRDNSEYLKAYTLEEYEEWKNQILTLFNIPIN